MTALVGSNRGGGDRAGVVDGFGEVHGAFHGVVVVGEGSGGAGDGDVVDAVVAQHSFGHFAAGEARGGGDLAVGIEFLLQIVLGDPAENHEANEDNPINAHNLISGLSVLVVNVRF